MPGPFDTSDVKIGVSADLSLAEQEGQRWGQSFMKGVGSGLGSVNSMLLGNGMPTTQGPSSSQNNVTNLLGQILAALQVGFSRLQQPGGGGAGGAGGGGNGNNPPPPLPPPTGGGGGNSFLNGAGNLLKGAGNIGRMVDSLFPGMSYMNAMAGGWYGTDLWNLADDIAGRVPLVGQITGAGKWASHKMDQFAGETLDVFRQQGDPTRLVYQDMAQGAESRRFMRRYGVTRPEMLKLAQQAGTGGVVNSTNDLSNYVQMEGLYGMGGSTISLMSALKRGGALSTEDGNKPPNAYKVMADSIAVAISQHLDRGRWPEMQRAIERAADAMGARHGGNWEEQLMKQQMFIGTFGENYKGGSVAGQRATSMMEGLRHGEGGGFAKMMAMRAAGLGEGGKDFWTAQLDVAEGKVSDQQIIEQYLEAMPKLKEMISQGRPGIAQAAGILHVAFRGRYSLVDLAAMLRSIAKGNRPVLDQKAIAEAHTRLQKSELPNNRGRDLAERNVKREELGAVASTTQLEAEVLSDAMKAAGLPFADEMQRELKRRRAAGAKNDTAIDPSSGISADPAKTGLEGGGPVTSPSQASGPISATGSRSNIDAIMAAIRKKESGSFAGNYTARNPSSTASGAYQFTKDTWAGYGGYMSAADAPPGVQDEYARMTMERYLKNNNGDMRMVPASWFAGPGGAATRDWDTVPGTANKSTIREYVDQVMQYYEQAGGTADEKSTSGGAGPVSMNTPAGRIDIYVHESRVSAVVKSAAKAASYGNPTQMFNRGGTRNS